MIFTVQFKESSQLCTMDALDYFTSYDRVQLTDINKYFPRGNRRGVKITDSRYFHNLTYNGRCTERFTKPFPLYSEAFDADGTKLYPVASPDEPLFDPDNILVVNDFRCPSSCSVFTKLIQKNHLAKRLASPPPVRNDAT